MVGTVRALCFDQSQSESRTLYLHDGRANRGCHPHRERLAAALPGTTLFTSTREDPLYFTFGQAAGGGGGKKERLFITVSHRDVVTTLVYLRRFKVRGSFGLLLSHHGVVESLER